MNKSVDKYTSFSPSDTFQISENANANFVSPMHDTCSSHLTYPVSITVLICGDNKNYGFDMG
jgi:hypothetical protein